MSDHVTPKMRIEQAIRILDDPVLDLDFKEATKFVYHTLVYEVLQFRINRLQQRKLNHGDFIVKIIEIANFKHELQDL